jgi:hypothetical protein
MGEAGTDALPALTDMYNRAIDLGERRELLAAISNIVAPEGVLRVPGVRGQAGGKGKGGKGKSGKGKIGG